MIHHVKEAKKEALKTVEGFAAKKIYRLKRIMQAPRLAPKSKGRRGAQSDKLNSF